MKATALLRPLFLVLLFSMLTGCNSSDDSTSGAINTGGSSTSSIAGSYNMVSMNSDIAVDLNNDGIQSTNLFDEIDASFFSSTNPELEIKAVFINNQLKDMVNFYLPHPTVTVNTPTKPGTVNFTRGGLGYTLSFNSSNQAIQINKDNTPPSSLGDVTSVEVVSKNILKAVFKKYYYDFLTSEWKLLTITCIYNKI